MYSVSLKIVAPWSEELNENMIGSQCIFQQGLASPFALQIGIQVTFTLGYNIRY